MQYNALRSGTDPEERLELSVVMPCLNEAETLASCIDKAMETMPRTTSRVR